MMAPISPGDDGDPPDEAGRKDWRQRRTLPGERVLVVEDDGLIALAMADVLTSLGAGRIAVCSRADEAIELIAHLRPTLLILDLALADRRDGWAVAQLAREMLLSPPAIIFATGSPERLPRDLARLGQVLRKPFAEQALAAAVLRAQRRRGLLARLWQGLAG